jgi:CubicO group peptidase (beta-lactamase class C family)
MISHSSGTRAASGGARGALQDALRVVGGWLEYQRAFRRIPGLSVGLVHGDEMIFSAAFGYAEEAARRKATIQTCYRIASISKVFTATAVMQLAERGLVRLDEHVDRYVPWFRSRRGPSLAPITVRQLLSHTAGVERDGAGHWHNDRFPTLQQIKSRVRDGIAIFAPLERWKYSNLGYVILGQVVAEAAGRPYEDYVRTEIIEPLRLSHTGFALGPKVIRALAVGYGRDLSGRPRQAFGHPDANGLRAAAGLVSNVVDLCAFMSAQLPGSGRLLTDLSKREMQRPQWLRNGDDRYGLGFNIWTVDGKPIVGHGGGFQGFKTAIGMDVERRIGVAVLTNAIDGPAEPLMVGIFQTINDCLRPPDRPARSMATRASLRKYEGRYVGRWWDLEVVAVGGRLLAYDASGDRPLREASVLQRRTRERFRIVDGPGGGHVGEAVTFRWHPRRGPVGLWWGPNPMRRVRRPPGS